MSRLPLPALAAGLFVVATPAFAQFGATPPVPAGRFQAPLDLRPSVPTVRPPAAQPATTPSPRPAVAAVSQAQEPTYEAATYDRIGRALDDHLTIAQRGGWPMLPAETKIGPGASGPEVATLRRRLAVTGDLGPNAATGSGYDEILADGIRRFQARHGLAETGTVGPQTLAALNVPVGDRIRQLSASRERLNGSNFVFGQRYVVVNIPAAVAEAVSGGEVERRYVAVVGKPDRPSPTLTTAITAVNLNPTWTVPLSIVKKDIVPKMRKDPGYVARMRMRLLDGQGHEVDPRAVDWKAERTPGFTIRQDSGSGNALGAVRIDMPNPHSVYMHDTNHKNLFSADYRFHSSGCARIADVRSLAAWLLADNSGWSRREIDTGIAAAKRTDIRLARAVPVAWVYLTGWATRDGRVHFRNDVYKHDTMPERPFMVQLPATIVTAARASGFSLQSAGSRPELVQVSFLDSQ